ncbi:lipopolysaccharide biosynthesis protein [Ruminococcus flavefaciens]|uniref:lipopolysaccharide biosynthesis protein n=1 Tax=Ruminococcus flavefaciens TaxID=1265 RepID=UPI0026EA9C93|nr:oligosaccharide flippase family protein [Ruminococcus flavefaciens]MDD7517114.1 oligosaccharide flippase family protein [Ruminococcus flavefaciens]MDY5692109.1 oligosaccharide flippase family protein [Ruminococcus flavefaciens]
MTLSIRKLRNKWGSMSKEARASVAYALCSIVQKCISFINMPIFTRLMSTDEYGEMTVYSSWSGIFSIVLTLNLAYGSFSPAMIKFEKDRDRYISAIQGIWLVLCSFFLVIYLPFQGYWNKILDLPTLFVLFLILETLSINSINLWSGRKRFDYEYKPVVALTLIMSVANTAVSLAFVLLSTQKGEARVIGHVVATVAFGLIIFSLNAIKGKSIFHKEYWKYALGFNIPLLAYYLSQMVFNQSDRIMIDRYCGKGKAAIYGVAYTLAMILTFVLNAINNSYVPWFYKKIKEGKEEENAKVANGIAILMAGLILCIVIMAPEVILVMGGEKYAEAIWIIPPVAISLLLLFYAQLFINVQFYYEKKSKLVYASIGAAVANIVLNAILIPNVSYIAAGYTTMISYILFAVMNFFTMRKVAKETGFSMKALDTKMLCLIFIGFCSVCFLMMALYKLTIIRYIVIFVALIVGIIKRKELTNFANSVLKRKA